MKDTHSVAMGNESLFQRTCKEYSEWSLVHGVAYVFATSLPSADRVAWGLLVFAGLGLASYWSIASYNTWQEELTITTLKDAAMPINKIPFPAVTICSSGLDMEAVKKALMIDFDTWMMEEGRVSVDKVEDKKNWEEFMLEKFAIKDRNKNIFDILRAFQSTHPEQTIKSLFQMEGVLACAGQQGSRVLRKKRSTSVAQTSLPYWDQTGNLYTKIAVPDDNLMGRNIVRDTCLKEKMEPLCWSTGQSSCNKGNLVGRKSNLAERLSTIICGTHEAEKCSGLQDVFFFVTAEFQFANPSDSSAAGDSMVPTMLTSRGVVGGDRNVIGIYVTSTSSHPLYAACIQQSGW